MYLIYLIKFDLTLGDEFTKEEVVENPIEKKIKDLDVYLVQEDTIVQSNEDTIVESGVLTFNNYEIESIYTWLAFQSFFWREHLNKKIFEIRIFLSNFW